MQYFTEITPYYQPIAYIQTQRSWASHCFETYVSFLEEHRPEAVNLVTHHLLHIIDQSGRFGVHPGAISCYPFENFLSLFRKVR